MRDPVTAPIITGLVAKQIKQATRLRDMTLYDNSTYRLLVDSDFDDEGSDKPFLTAWDLDLTSHALARWDSYGSSNQGGVLAIDFEEVQTVSASWWERVWMRVLEESWHWRLYPIAANVPEPAVVELELVARMHRQVFAICQMEGRSWFEPQLVGSLEQREREALDFILAHPKATASDLYEAQGTISSATRISASAWSNVLARLHKRRLIYEHKRGRQHQYLPIMPFSLQWDPGTHPVIRGQIFYITAPGGEG